MIPDSGLPPSSSWLCINMVGVAGYGLFIVMALLYYPFLDPVAVTVLALLAAVIPIILLERLFLPLPARRTTGSLPVDKAIIRTKITGLYGSVAIIGLLYLVFPEYRQAYYSLYWEFIVMSGMLIFACGFFYLEIVEKYFPPHGNGVLQMGLLLEGRFKEINRTLLEEHCREWLIKAFFLPLMFSDLAVRYDWFQKGKIYLSGYYANNGLVTYEALFPAADPNYPSYLISWILLSSFFLLTVELVFATAGYIFTFRWLSAGIQSTDTTVQGWVCCLICYAPFIGLLTASYLPFSGTSDWHSWLQEYPVLLCLYGALVCLSQAVYVLSIVNMGIRFSNLTYRGVITSGLYRYTKHPMYIAKCINWFLVCIPFLSHNGVVSAVYSTFVFMLLWLLYYWRARTEENHLSNYPEYIQYAYWINENGIFRKLTKKIPYLSYNYERTKRSCSSVWWKKSSRSFTR